MHIFPYFYFSGIIFLWLRKIFKISLFIIKILLLSFSCLSNTDYFKFEVLGCSRELRLKNKEKVFLDFGWFLIKS
jgi:hypothetical protein